MMKRNSLFRLAGSALFAASVLAFHTGCSKDEAASAPAPAAPEAETAGVTSPELFAQPIASTVTDPGTVLAVVNGHEITLGEFNKEMDGVISRMQGRVPPQRLAQMRMQMRDQLLDNMITRQVLLDKITEEKIEVTDDEIAETITEITETLPPGMTLDDMLAQTGTSEEEFRESLTSEIKIRKLIEGHIGKPVPATDEEIQAFYDENKEQFEKPESVTASHILIGFEPTDTEDQKVGKRKQIEDIRNQLLEGADFAELAMEHSSCPSSAQGGSLGSFPRGAMVPAFEEAAFSQDIDAIGEVVETQFGYHVVKVSERSEAGLTPLEEVKEQLSTYLSNQKQQTGVQTYVRELRESADITIPGEDS